MKRPFLIVALLYLAGILLGEFLRPPLPVLFGSAFAVGIAGILWSRGRAILLTLLLVVTGWTLQVYRTAIPSPNDLRVLIENRTEDVRVRGKLCAPPAERIFERNEQELWRTTAVVEVEQLCRDETWRRAFGKVSINTLGILPSDFFEGQTVEVRGIISPPGGPLAPGLFDSKAQLQRKGIYYRLSAITNDWQVISTGVKRPLSDRFHDWAKKTLAIGLPQEDQALRLTWTLMLDWKAPMTEAVEEPFFLAGTYHIFAVDGLRIGLISGILILFFRVLQIPRAISGLCLVIPAIWFYAGLTGFPASAIRACVMMTVLIAGWALRRPGNPVNSLLAAAFILLLWDPQQLFQPGFQLSFLVVLCLILLLPVMNDGIQVFLRGDPLLPEELKPRHERWIRAVGRYVFGVAAISVAAWLASLPLAAHYFHLFNPVSIPANCAVVPLTTVALTSNLASLIVGAWWPFGAELFNNASWLMMKGVIWLSHWFAGWPGAYWYVSSPGALTYIAYYAVLLAVLSGWIFRAAHKRAAIAGLAALVAAWAVNWAISGQRVQIHILPLSGGHAVFVAAYKNDLLIDCGNLRPATSVTEPFLKAQGINRLPNFCLSHASHQQMGGAQIIYTNFPTGRTFIGSLSRRSPEYRRVLEQLEKTPERRVALKSGDRIGAWTVLNPPVSNRTAPADDNAVVLYGEICHQSILLLSDLNRTGQNSLIESHPGLRADIVVAGLPVEGEPVCDWLLDTVQPKLIIIADTDYPAPRRASKKLRDRLAARTVPVLYCRDVGAVTLDLAPHAFSIRSSDGSTILLTPTPARESENSTDER